MGANYKTGRRVFDAVTSSNVGEESIPAIIKSADKAGILLQNTGSNSVDVLVQVAASPSRSGGINALDDINTDTNWHAFNIIDDTGAPVPVVLSIAASATLAVDLSVFAFDAIRLIADSTTDGLHGVITADIVWGTI